MSKRKAVASPTKLKKYSPTRNKGGQQLRITPELVVPRGFKVVKIPYIPELNEPRQGDVILRVVPA